MTRMVFTATQIAYHLALTITVKNDDEEAGVMIPLHLGAIAIRTGRKLHWDAQSMSVRNDPEANAMLSKEYRAGWDMRGL